MVVRLSLYFYHVYSLCVGEFLLFLFFMAGVGIPLAALFVIPVLLYLHLLSPVVPYFMSAVTFYPGTCLPCLSVQSLCVLLLETF